MLNSTLMHAARKATFALFMHYVSLCECALFTKQNVSPTVYHKNMNRLCHLPYATNAWLGYVAYCIPQKT